MKPSQKAPIINTWPKFSRLVRSKGCHLLAKLDSFSDSVLVTGCQRSGTTIVSRIITQSEGMTNFWFGPDDELDAALILSGYVDYESDGRHCFQTTYLNECFNEYFSLQTRPHIIWVLRNPYNVVYSLLHNWKRFAFNELFDALGHSLLDGADKKKYERFGRFTLGRLKMACLSYNAKLAQLFELYDKYNTSRLLVVDYDSLVLNPEIVLPAIYDFINLPFKEDYTRHLHRNSLAKSDRLSRRERTRIEQLCLPFYEEGKKICDRY